MSSPATQFPYIARDPALGSASFAPMLPITLQAAQIVPVSALLDTGAAVNVLPFSIGLQLGFLWDQQKTTVQLTGRSPMIVGGRDRNSIGLIPRRINSAYGCLMERARMPCLSGIPLPQINTDRPHSDATDIVAMRLFGYF